MRTKEEIIDRILALNNFEEMSNPRIYAYAHTFLQGMTLKWLKDELEDLEND